MHAEIAPDAPAQKRGAARSDWLYNHIWEQTETGWETLCGLQPSYDMQRSVRYYPDKPACPDCLDSAPDTDLI